MAVYQGTPLPAARLRAPLATPRVSELPPARRTARLAAREQHGLRTVAVVLALILAGTIFGLAYLTQTLGAASARFEIDELSRERQVLFQELQSQQGTIARGGSEALVVGWAQRDGLDRLGATIRLKAR